MKASLEAGKVVSCDHVSTIADGTATYLHLMPLLKMPHPQNDGGYAVEDFDTVDPSLGTNEDLAALTKKLRAAGISLCLDFVMNHTASSHRWAKGRLKRAIRNIRITTTATMTALFPISTTPWYRKSSRPPPPATSIWNEQMHKWVLTSFYPFQWDLNYHNPNVLVSVLSSVLGLANLGVEVFRIDAVPYIWKRTRHQLPQPAASAHHRAHVAHRARMRLPVRSAEGRSGDGPQGARRLLRHAGKAGMPHALQRVDHGESVECACQWGRAPAQRPA